jgi:hypothetical protein
MRDDKKFDVLNLRDQESVRTVGEELDRIAGDDRVYNDLSKEYLAPRRNERINWEAIETALIRIVYAPEDR